MTRTGVFLCGCDGKVDRGIDVQAVATSLESEAYILSMPHVCLPDGIQDLREAIVENNLDRVLIAACPDRFQEKNLGGACRQAGINFNQFALVDWREGCAWAHGDNRWASTEKAIDLVRMGLAHVTNARPLDGVRTRIAPGVLVIGGGISGMTAAKALAAKGILVSLIEREPELGGQLRHVPLNGFEETFERTTASVLNDSRINVLLGSRVSQVEGSIGSYHIDIAQSSRQEPQKLDAGAIIIATGAREHRAPGMYRHDRRRVVTLWEFEEQNNSQSTSSSTPFPSSIVYLLCASSRDGNLPYCSNICCVNALKQAIRIKTQRPTSTVTILFRDLYLLGDELNDELIREARRVGIDFFRYALKSPPRVNEDFIELETSGVKRWIGYDRLVLATGLVPDNEAGFLARLFGLGRDQDGFFLDPHYRVGADQEAETGIYLCGSAHRPVDPDTAILQAMTAAARAARFVGRRELMRPALSAWVKPELCTGCGKCVGSCTFNAIKLTRVRAEQGTAMDRAVIQPFLCQFCGNCVVECPTKAIDLPASTDSQILGQVDAALAGRRLGEPRILVFGCRWSGFAAMELAGARKLNYSAQVRTIELPCSARLDPLHVLYAFLNGADAVMLALCPPNECHFGKGNEFAERRLEILRTALAANGIDPGRLIIKQMMGDDAAAWVSAVNGSTQRKWILKQLSAT